MLAQHAKPWDALRAGGGREDEEEEEGRGDILLWAQRSYAAFSLLSPYHPLLNKSLPTTDGEVLCIHKEEISPSS